MRAFATSKVVVPSWMEKASMAMAIPPWNEWCVITETSPRAIISPVRK